MNKGLVAALAVAAMFTACKNYKKGPGDLQYKVLKEGKGAQIAEGDFVKLNVIEKTEGDSVKMSSYDMDRPYYLPIQKSVFKGDIIDGLKLLKEGDSATIKINLDSVAAHGGQKDPKSKDKYSIFTFKIEKVLKKDPKDNEQQADEKRRAFYMQEISAFTQQKKTQEPGIIANYIKANSLSPKKTSTGLQYVINKQGSGAPIQKGDTAYVNYTGRFMRKDAKGNYTVFDTSLAEEAKKAGHFQQGAQYGPRPFVVGSTIPGFDEGLQLLNAGSKAQLLIPSNLGYGAQGMQLINPYTPLVFDVEVVRVVKPKPGSNVAKPAMPNVQQPQGAAPQVATPEQAQGQAPQAAPRR